MKGYPLYLGQQFEIQETRAYTITKRSSSVCLGFQTVVILDLNMGSFDVEVVFFYCEVEFCF